MKDNTDSTQTPNSNPDPDLMPYPPHSKAVHLPCSHQGLSQQLQNHTAETFQSCTSVTKYPRVFALLIFWKDLRDPLNKMKDLSLKRGFESSKIVTIKKELAGREEWQGKQENSWERGDEWENRTQTCVNSALLSPCSTG